MQKKKKKLTGNLLDAIFGQKRRGKPEELKSAYELK